jgi:hypothetical protein
MHKTSKRWHKDSCADAAAAAAWLMIEMGWLLRELLLQRCGGEPSGPEVWERARWTRCCSKFKLNGAVLLSQPLLHQRQRTRCCGFAHD